VLEVAVPMTIAIFRGDFAFICVFVLDERD
jgi:hypothetical protein